MYTLNVVSTTSINRFGNKYNCYKSKHMPHSVGAWQAGEQPDGHKHPASCGYQPVCFTEKNGKYWFIWQIDEVLIG